MLECLQLLRVMSAVMQVAQSEADGLRGELAEALQTGALLEASLRQAEAEVNALPSQHELMVALSLLDARYRHDMADDAVYQSL